MLTIGLCIGAGAAAAYIQGQPGIGRAMYLFGGVFIGALGFLLGAMTFPDTNVGLFLGAFVPQLITGFAAMWSKRTEMFIAATIGAGALAGVYANDFDLDPQSINVSLPIALGTTIFLFVNTFVGGVLTLAAPILAVNNIEVIYDHVILVLKGVSLEVPKGGIVALLGANGAGKSTLMRLIAGEMEPVQGRLERSARVRIGYLEQDTVLDSDRPLRDAVRERAFGELLGIESELEDLTPVSAAS